uniref:Uncharacterized protein TCIL3000_4_820 n=1 Tax=Trypanosoma congolense (strain IL3000) TaxID=1068625 RepID=G0UKU3_TRYCI|nr:unnamed protein product [Trypanosoma congolense IL3000]
MTPNVAAEAVAHWNTRWDSTPFDVYKRERRAAYRVRILGRAPASELEERMRVQKNYPDVDIGPPEETLETDYAQGGLPTESLIPPRTTPVDAVAVLAQTIVERGARDPKVPQVLEELAHYIKQVSTSTDSKLSSPQCATLLTACKIMFSVWGADGAAATFVPRFFKNICQTEQSLGLSAEQEEQLTSMTKEFSTV